MRYLCLIFGSDEQFSVLTEKEAEDMVDEHLAYDEVLRSRGHWVHAEALGDPSTGVVVRMRNGRLSTTTGPFMETREQLGGFFLIEAADLDEAIRIAGHIPSARLGAVEVRPIRDLQAEKQARKRPQE